MSVDRGGLQYTIVVDGEWKGELDRFRDNIKGARADLDSLRKSRRSRSGQATSDATREKKELDSLALAARNYRKQWKGILVKQQEGVVASGHRFRNEREIRTSMETRRKAEQEVNRVVGDRTKLEQRAAAVAANRIKLTEAETVKLGLASKLHKQRAEAVARLSKAEQDVNRIIRDRTILQERSAAVSKAGLQLTEKEATRLGLASKLPATAVAPVNEKDTRTLWQRITAWLNLVKAHEKTNSSANRLSFTFRRLFGILAAFAAARAALRYFVETVRAMVAMNAKLEQIQLGLASLFLAVGSVTNAMGQTVGAAEGLVIAQQEARRQTNLLRRDALKTAATFEQLADTFQVAIAPGLSAGLSVSQIREFTVRVSQAAAAIGLQQNQLAEEIRSILSGTIQARTTRLAVALGITNEDVRNAKEMGTLAEFLRVKFSAFATAGEEALNTFAAVLTNLKDSFLVLLQQGGFDFFDSVKSLLKELRALVVNEDSISGLITPDPGAVYIVKAFAAGLQVAADEARALIKTLRFEDIANFAHVIGFTLGSIPKLLAGAISGFSKGLGQVTTATRFLLALFQKITGIDIFDLNSAKGMIEAISQLAGWFLGVKVAILAINAAIVFAKVATLAWSIVSGVAAVGVGIIAVAWGTVTGAISTANAAAAVFTALTGGLPILILLAVAAIAAVGAGIIYATEQTRKWMSEVVGVDLKFLSMLKIIKLGLALSFAHAFLAIRHGWNEFWQAAKIDWINFTYWLRRTFTEAWGGILGIMGLVSKAAAAAQQELNDNLKKAKREQKALLALEEKKLQAVRDRWDLEKRLLDENALADLNQIIADNDATPSLKDLAVNTAKAIIGPLGDVMRELMPQIDAGVDSAASLSQTFAELPGIIQASRRPLSENIELVKRFKNELLKAQEALAVSRATTGLSAPIASANRAAIESQYSVAEERRKLLEEEKKIQADRLSFERQLLGVEARMASMSASDLAIARKVQEAYRTQAAMQTKVFEAKGQIQLLQDRLRSSEKEGQAALVAAIETQKTLLSTQIQQLDAEKAKADALLTNVTNGEKITKLALDEISLKGKLVVTDANLRDIAADRLAIEQKRLEILDQTLLKMAEENIFQQNQEVATARQEAASLRAIRAQEQAFRASVGQGIKPEGFLELEQSKQKLALEQQQVTLREAQRMRDQEALTAQIILLNQQGASQDLLNAKQTEFNNLIEQARLSRESERDTMAEMGREIEKARLIAERPMESGFFAALADMTKKLPTQFEMAFQLTQGAVEKFSAFVSDSIVSAFDPSSDMTIQERFAAFLKNIGAMIIQMMVQIAVTRAVLGLVGLFGGGASVAAFAKRGGRVPEDLGTARGYARGGPAKPSGVPASDTVPAWLTPGEFVMRVDAVRAYGSDFMRALNERLINPFSIRALAGLGGSSPARSAVRKGPGFAAGGTVPSRTDNRDSDRGRTAAVVPALLVANEHQMSKLLAGGRGSVLEFLRANAGEVRAMLNM